MKTEQPLCHLRVWHTHPDPCPLVDLRDASVPERPPTVVCSSGRTGRSSLSPEHEVSLQKASGRESPLFSCHLLIPSERCELDVRVSGSLALKWPHGSSVPGRQPAHVPPVPSVCPSAGYCSQADKSGQAPGTEKRPQSNGGAPCLEGTPGGRFGSLSLPPVTSSSRPSGTLSFLPFSSLFLFFLGCILPVLSEPQTLSWGGGERRVPAGKEVTAPPECPAP